MEPEASVRVREAFTRWSASVAREVRQLAEVVSTGESAEIFMRTGFCFVFGAVPASDWGAWDERRLALASAWVDRGRGVDLVDTASFILARLRELPEHCGNTPERDVVRVVMGIVVLSAVAGATVRRAAGMGGLLPERRRVDGATVEGSPDHRGTKARAGE